jgi:hypothetical protein
VSDVLLALVLVAANHTASMTLAGRLLGQHVMLVSLGIGDCIPVAVLLLRAIPISGSVRFLHSVDDEAPLLDSPNIIDRCAQPFQPS